jgi:hypothetical protein
MNAESFTNSVQKDLSHRKLELSRLSLGVRESHRQDDHLSWFTRAAVVLAYAHWEGFIKESGIKYLKFLNAQQIVAETLKLELQAAFVAAHFKRAQESTKASFLGDLLGQIDACRRRVFSVNPRKVIDTESNLSSTVFRELVRGIGLDYLDLYATREVFVDSKIVYGRNSVAHGELVNFTAEEALDRVDGVVYLLDCFADQLILAVRDQAFLLEGTRAAGP